MVVVALFAATIVLIPLTPLKTSAKARLTRFLVERLGQGAGIDDIEYGWRSVTLKAVRLSLDRNGSELRVGRVEVAIDPWSVVRAPDRVERMIHGLRFVEPVLVLRKSAQRPTDSTAAPWLPEIKIPRAIFPTLSRLDSLKHVAFVHGRVLAEDQSRNLVALARFDISLQPNAAGALQIAGSGIYGDRNEQTIALTGTLVARQRTAEIQATLTIPAGTPPPLLGTLPVVLTTQGGKVALRISVQDSVLRFRGSAAVDGVTVEAPGGTMRVAEVNATFSGDTLAFDPIEITAPAGRVTVNGGLLLRGPGTWLLNAEFTVPDAAKLHASLAAIPDIQGAFAGRLAITGELAAPQGELELQGDSLRIYGLRIETLRMAATASTAGIVVHELQAETPEGRLELTGGIDFSTPARVTAGGLLTLDRGAQTVGVDVESATDSRERRGSPGGPECAGGAAKRGRAAVVRRKIAPRGCGLDAGSGKRRWRQQPGDRGTARGRVAGRIAERAPHAGGLVRRLATRAATA